MKVVSYRVFAEFTKDFKSIGSHKFNSIFDEGQKRFLFSCRAEEFFNCTKDIEQKIKKRRAIDLFLKEKIVVVFLNILK